MKNSRLFLRLLYALSVTIIKTAATAVLVGFSTLAALLLGAWHEFLINLG